MSYYWQYICVLGVFLIAYSSDARLVREDLEDGEYRLNDAESELMKRGIMKMRIGKRGSDISFEDFAEEPEPAYVYLPERVMKGAWKRAGIRRMRMG